MTQTTLKVVAQCTKCGRKFLTLPRVHMVDMFQDRETYEYPCGGPLAEIENAA